MIFNKKIIRHRLSFIFIVLFMSLSVFGCSAKESSSNAQSETDKSIEDSFDKEIMAIVSNRQNNVISVRIKGSSELSYSAVKEKNPDAVVLYFPSTRVNNSINAHDISLGVLQDAELKQEENDAKLRLFLSGDFPYEARQEGTDLFIDIKSSVSKEDALPSKTELNESREEASETANSIKKESVAAVKDAKMLSSVNVEDKGDYFCINILADGTIKKYNSFSLNNPPRIVFDLPGISSPHKKVEKLEIGNQWAKSLRHYDNKVRLRLVLDTRAKWLNNYSAAASDSGLTIYLGKKVAQSEAVHVKPAEHKTKTAVTKTELSYAYLNDINFSALENGSSKITITTSKEAEFSAEKPKKGQIALRLKNTKIADYHQRPILTTRFDSAIDRIYPVYNPKINKNDSLILIDLREDVPFRINRMANSLILEFDPSVKVGSDNDELVSPEWKTLLSKSVESLDEEKTSSDLISDNAAKTDEVISLDKTKEAVAAEENLDEDEQDFSSDTKNKKYSGQVITLDFYETDIKNVFRIIQHVSGLNFAIDKDVNGKVTMSLKQPVPWDQVLDLILKMNSLGMEREGNIVRIANLTTLEAEEQRKKQMLQAKEESMKQEKNLAPLFTEYLLINYSDAEGEILPHVKEIISDRGVVSVDKRNNQIILTDTEERIDKAKELISKIDKITPQVVIEARIVEATSNFSKDIGTDWTASSDPADASSSATIYKDALGGSYGYGVSMNTPDKIGTIGINFSRLTGTPFILNAKLKAMESQDKGKIISAPKVVTLDNKKATIKQGFEYPYTTIDDGDVKTEFKKIDMQLDVTPHVTADNKIALKVNIDKNDVYQEALTKDGAPALSTKNVQSELLVNDGDTIVIGGIIQQSQRYQTNNFPYVSKIPLLGWLFKSKSDKKEKSELLIFLTPRIVELEKGKF